MTKQQILKLMAALVEHQKYFVRLPTEDAQWVIQNTEAAISKMVENLTGGPVCGATEQASATMRKLLMLVRTIHVPAVPRFIAAEKFKPGETVDGVKISRGMGYNFKKFYYPNVESRLAPQ